MRYRKLGKTGLKVSEIGFGAEWLQGKSVEEAIELVNYCHDEGVNFLDCWMSEPNVRTNLGIALKDQRDDWIIQGHLGSTWQDGQYVRTRDMDKVIPAFEDFMERFQIDYLDFGMIHYVDEIEELESIFAGEFIEYVRSLKDDGIIRHIGLSTHSPRVALRATEIDEIELIMFSINPAFDMRPATEELESMFDGYDNDRLSGIDPERARFYQMCEEENVGLTVMKGFFGGALLDKGRSPFGVAFTPVQLIHYALTRPGVSSILCGYDTKEQVDAAVSYEDASDDEKD